jgi:hypothetical protein
MHADDMAIGVKNTDDVKIVFNKMCVWAKENGFEINKEYLGVHLQMTRPRPYPII